MNNISNNLKFVIIFLVFSFLAGFYLFQQENLNHNYQNSDWTVAYFTKPNQSESLDFILENYETDPINYQYAIQKQSGTILGKGEIHLNSGEKKAIYPEFKEKAIIIINYNNQQIILKR